AGGLVPHDRCMYIQRSAANVAAADRLCLYIITLNAGPGARLAVRSMYVHTSIGRGHFTGSSPSYADIRDRCTHGNERSAPAHPRGAAAFCGGVLHILLPDQELHGRSGARAHATGAEGRSQAGVAIAVASLRTARAFSGADITGSVGVARTQEQHEHAHAAC